MRQQIAKSTANTRVNAFLNSIGRNSKNSRIAYSTALTHFAQFLLSESKELTPDNVIPLLTKGKVNLYELLDGFVSYLTQHVTTTASTIRLYIAAIRSFIEYYDIDISNAKFKRRVKLPKHYPDPEEPLTIQDARELINQCRNERLACYLLLLMSTGMRATEATSLRLRDIDFSVSSPTRINVRKETTKTKRGRIIYCSDEATKQIRILIEQHRKRNHTPLAADDFLFTILNGTKRPRSMYQRLLEQFERLQEKVHKDQRKENSKRRKITLHSFRRTAFSIINEQTNSEYANWFLGHNHSVYWTHTEKERREIYLQKCMPSLTILDYTAIDKVQKNIQDELHVKDKQIQELMQFKQEIQVMLNEPEKFIDMLQEGMRLGNKQKK